MKIRLIKGLFAVAACLAIALAPTAQAQVQRSFINLGFEQPALNGNSTQFCYRQLQGQNSALTPQVPGWRSTHPTNVVPDTLSTNCTITNTQPGRLIEIWRNGQGFQGPAAPPRAGRQHAELNAQAVSSIYQRVCLVAGESVRWRFSHRGRGSATVGDVADFLIGTANDATNSLAGTRIVRATDSNDGSPGAASQCITGGACARAQGPNGWGDYTGNFVVTPGFAGVRDIGFIAVSSATDNTSGNFIDDITVELKPFVEFASATYVIPERGPVNVQVRVVGVVPAPGVVVPITRTGGTATAGGDYTLGTLTIPPGDYEDGTPVNVPLNIVDDAVIENNETLTLAITASTVASPYVLTSTTACGAPPVASTTVTIVDNDIDLRTTKTSSAPAPIAGVPFTYTVTFQNNTARPTVAPLASRDVSAQIADLVPAGLSFSSWTCTASGGAACPAASGSGALGGNVLLPAGNGAAGPTVTFTINAVATGLPQCGVITNTSRISLPDGFQEGALVQAGFPSPAPGGEANNTASVDVDPVCRPTLTLDKITQGAAGGPFGFTLTNTTQAAGSATTVSADTPVRVDGDASVTGVQPFTVAAVGTAVTITESALPSGWTLGDASCAIAGQPVGSRSGSSYEIPAANVVEGAEIACTFRNRRRLADLSISKTNTPATGPDDPSGDVLLRGARTTYTVVVRNEGPDAADRALARDQPMAGLTACAVTCPAAGLSGGATCPVDPAGLLEPAGAEIPLLPANSSVTFLVTCTVQ